MKQLSRTKVTVRIRKAIFRKTTQIYAQIVDEKKQKAANAIKLNI